jgi:predicted DNA-binding protein YlxM (UPF0122 family)
VTVCKEGGGSGCKFLRLNTSTPSFRSCFTKERGLSHREIKDKFHASLGAISNILKRKNEYINDYETNQNKKMKRKLKDDFSQTINDTVYEWFVAQRTKNIPLSGPILQEYARKVAEELGDRS